MDGNNSTTPQIMQFKASQKLLQPNQSLPQNPQEQKSRGIGTNEKSRVAINTMNQAPPSSRQLFSRASGQYAEMADTTIHRSDRPIREVENNNSLSGEGLSIRSNKKINPAVAKALEEIKAWFVRFTKKIYTNSQLFLFLL
uniref:Uncharacterized protein n=1 Tax=Panagrolaimus superbus TaxID=310955 RepID=A0A914YSU7_9BILA